MPARARNHGFSPRKVGIFSPKHHQRSSSRATTQRERERERRRRSVAKGADGREGEREGARIIAIYCPHPTLEYTNTTTTTSLLLLLGGLLLLVPLLLPLSARAYQRSTTTLTLRIWLLLGSSCPPPLYIRARHASRCSPVLTSLLILAFLLRDIAASIACGAPSQQQQVWLIHQW